MENNFLGVSNETAQNVMMYSEKVQNYVGIYKELDELLKQKYHIESLAILAAELMKASRGLFKNLQEAKSQAVLQSDKEEIEMLIQNYTPLINMFGDIGESMLTNSTEEQLCGDSGLAEMIGGALS